jgi:CCR4-NOT transcription complex subunit 1
VQLLVQDNLDVACAAIEKAAMERATADVDEGFASSYEIRRRHREVRASAAFFSFSRT